MANLSLTAKLGLDKTGFDAGMTAAGKQAGKFGSALKGQLAAAFGTAAIAAYTRQLLQAVGHIKDLSDRTGVSTTALQEMEYAGKAVGVTLDDIAQSFRALSKSRAEAMQNPKSDAAQAFGAMGIDRSMLQADSLEQTFRRIANTIRSTDFGASELVLVNTLLGRAAGELIPLFKTNMEESAEEAHRLGVILDDEVVNSLDRAGDAVDRLGLRMRGVLAPIVERIADILLNIIDALDISIGGAGRFIAGVAAGRGIKESAHDANAHVQEIISRIDARDRQPGIGALMNDPLADNRVKKNFEFEKAAEPKVEKRAGFQADENPFGRIGVFTGAAARAGGNPEQRAMVEKLELIEKALTTRGIVLKDIRR